MKTKIILTIIFVLMVGFTVGFIIGYKSERTELPQVEQEPILDTLPVPVDTLSDWQTLQLAIALTESRCNPNATGRSNDAGILQLTPLYIKEANRVGGTNYAHSDAYDPLKSLLMFRAVQDYHNPEHDQNKAIKLHNPRGASIGYPQKVKQNIELVKRYEKLRYEIRKCDESDSRRDGTLEARNGR